MLRSTCVGIALLLLFDPAPISPALAAGCATPTDAAALKTAVMQQELMVAALQCHETSAYNRFVMSYRSELQYSDAALKAYFIRRAGEHGEAGYDTFKTKAANLSALEQARHAGTFCADAHTLFAAAFANQGTLMSFVESRSAATDIGNICAESHPTLVLASAAPSIAPSIAPGAARSTPEVAAVGGVPPHSYPAIPFQRDSGALPAVAQGDAAPNNNISNAPPAYTNRDDVPPRPPRYYQIGNVIYDGYAQRNYAPPSWQQNWRNSSAPLPPTPYGSYP
jgi:hypothetical protein